MFKALNDKYKSFFASSSSHTGEVPGKENFRKKMVDKCVTASFLGSSLFKIKKLTSHLTALAYEVGELSWYFGSSLFPQLQATAALPDLEDSKTGSLFSFMGFFSTVKNILEQGNQYTSVTLFRWMGVAKQTADFILTSKGWLLGNQTRHALCHHSVNTLLVWTPTLLASVETLEVPALLKITTFITTICLTYSLYRDLASLRDVQARVASPTNQIIFNHLHALKVRIQALF